MRKLLVANRGEIAVRVMRAARELGVATVAVYADADAGAQHVRLADEAVHLGASAPAESYLSIPKLVAAARAVGADAVHPGYGFLAENMEFAFAVLDAGLTWVGPEPGVIRAMGDKANARAFAAAAGVPVLPGAAVDDPAALAALGFPLLVKAVAGGGGRGMREVAEAAALLDAVTAASTEAAAAFGDGRLYAERLWRPARHVEVQVLGDAAGGAAAVGVRDCSTQRRGQKLLEESPAPHLPTPTVEALEDAARRITFGLGYAGAGTVEFLVGPDGGFAFLEMNTRIQVEHGVTELVTGLDLVVEQLRIAAGARVPAIPSPRGWAIQARICAEDRAFRPAPGRLGRVEWPSGPGIRVDAGYTGGDEVPAVYDSLLAKVLAWGPDRETARRRLIGALGELQVEGVPTTAGLLREVLGAKAFIAGAVHTRWLEDELAGPLPAPVLARIAAAWVASRGGQAGAPSTTAAGDADPGRTTDPGPWRTLGRWP